MMVVVAVEGDGDGIGGTKEEQRKLDEGRQTEGMFASQYCATRATTRRSNQRSTLSFCQGDDPLPAHTIPLIPIYKSTTKKSLASREMRQRRFKNSGSDIRVPPKNQGSSFSPRASTRTTRLGCEMTSIIALTAGGRSTIPPPFPLAG